MVKLISYRELSEKQKCVADKMVYLLGTSVDENVFYIRDGQLAAVNKLVNTGNYVGSWGEFCYQCRVVIRNGDQHQCSGDNTQIYTVHTKEQAKYLTALKSFREQLLGT